MPNRKVGAGALAGALSVIVVWALRTYTDADVPAEIASAFTVVITFGVSYMVPEPGAQT